MFSYTKNFDKTKASNRLPMDYIIEQSTMNDLPQILELYDMAQHFQKQKKTVVVWPNFDSALMKKEILEGRQWKLIINKKIVCVWAIAHSDPQIWEERNNDAAIYIHRIATHDQFRGQHMVSKIVEWAKPFAKLFHKEYIRLDTLGDNQRLITYYKAAGFTFLGMFSMKNTDGLPAHYQNVEACLFEIKL